MDNQMTYKPIGTRVIIRPDGQRTETESGLLVYQEDKDVTQWGYVVAVGSDVRAVSVGDRIMYEKYAGDLLPWEDTEYLIMDVADILAVQLHL